MRKKERRLITFGLVVLFAAIAWWAYGHQTGAGVLLNLDYKVKVVYDGNKTLESEVQSITVKDTTAPTIESVSIDLKAVKDNKTNTTTYNFDITLNATDNDQIATYYVYYLNLGNKTSLPANATFSVVKSATPEVSIANITLNDNYAFYFVVEDVSGNKAMLYNETSPLIIQANSSATWPQVYPKANASG